MKPKSSRRVFLGQVAGASAIVAIGSRAHAHSWPADPSSESLTEKAVTFLKSRQEADGSWSPNRKEPGITALVITALLKTKQVTPTEPVITKGLTYLEGFLDAEGGMPKAAHANYSTAIALMAFHEANVGGRYDATIKGGQTFLKSKQWDESEGKNPADAFYGGAGYGGNNSRPDLSNTAFMMEALHDSGISADDPAMQEGPGLRLAVPEPQERVQRPALGRRRQRRRLRLHRGQRRVAASPGWSMAAGSGRTPR